MNGEALAQIEHLAQQCCQGIGLIGYYYPAEIFISEHSMLYAKYEYQEEIECFPDIFALLERELRQCKLNAVAMKSVKALDGKLQGLFDEWSSAYSRYFADYGYCQADVGS